jgi:MFS family permease
MAEMPPTFWFLWLGTLLNRLGSFVQPFLTYYLTSQLGFPISTSALMVSLLGAGSFISQLVGGELTDRLGRRPVMLMSFFISPIFMVALGLAREIWQMVPALLLLGFFMDLYRPAVNAAVIDLVPAEKRTRAFAYIYWAINLGFAASPIIAGFMATRNYFLLFVGDAITTFLFGLVVLAKVRETQPDVAVKGARVSVARRANQLLKEPVLLAFVALSFFFTLMFAQGYVTLPLDMQLKGLSPAEFGWAASVNGVLIILITLPSARFIERWPRFLAMGAAAALLGIGFGLTEFAQALPFFALTVVVWTLGEIIAANVAPVIISDLSPVELRGLYQGVYGSSWGLAFFVGPALGGYVYETYGSGTLWGACFVLGFLLFIAYWILGFPARRRFAKNT